MFGSTTNKFGTTSTFGAPGFGAATNTFGQSTPGFGVKQTTPVFGGFGATTAPATSNMFNNTTNTASTGLFGQTTGFGAAAAPTNTGFSGFGQTTTPSTLFGSTSQPNTGAGLFGGSATSAFGTPRPSFGGGTFNASTPSLFGQTQTQPTASLFGQSSVSTGGLFGSSGFAQPMTSGTTVKFNPPTGTDTMMKNGTSTNINTRHQCITCMKEYENKSLEELRSEDYLANRKGPQSVGFGATTPATGGLFGSTPATSSFSFNANQNKPSLFGTSTPGTFGTTSTPSLFGQNSQPANTGLFSKPLGFGTATTTAAAAPFSFGGSTNTPLFGQATQQKPMFGQTQTTGLFGAPATSQASSVFGSTPAFGTGFGQPAQQTGILGMKPAFGATTTTASAPFSFGTNTSTSGGGLFGNKLTATATTFPSSTGFQSFSTTPSNGLGLFNQKPATGFGATPGFGTSTGLQTNIGGLGTFGSSLGGSTGTSLFGNTATANKPLNFSFGASSQPFSFGNPTATSSMAPFNPTGIGTGIGLGMDANANNVANQTQAQQQILALANYPFSDSPLFRNLIRDTNKREEILKPTNPLAQKAMMNSPKIEAHAVGKLKPKPIQPLVNGNNSVSLFEGLEEEALALTNDIFVPRQSIKKLTIKPRLSPENKVLEESLASPAINSSESPIREPNFSPKNNDDLLNSGRNLTALENTISELQPRNTKLFEVAHSISSDHTENEDIDDASENLNDKNNNSSEKTSHPAGIVLTRAGYFTVPSMDTLASMVDKDGNCYVENFAVGRENYGNVCFFGVTNVAGLNLDEIIHFQRKQIVVYMDDDNKPPIGEGLNKKAQVTLDHVFPVDKTTHLPITIPEKIVATKFEENLEKASQKLGAKFIEYRPETGSWVFQVPHF